MALIVESDSFVEKRNTENSYKLLEEIFEACISEADLTDLIENLCHLYESFSSQGFESSFEEILMLPLSDGKRSSDVTKVFRFISEFIVALDNRYKAKHATDSEENECVHPLLTYLVNILANWSQSSSFVVRFRSCQLLSCILTNIVDNGVGEIDAVTFKTIAKLIEDRRVDVSANVRAHSVSLARFFQDPSDHDDPVISALCWQMQSDPNARVRQNIIEILAACEETIIPVTRRLLYDNNAGVRNAALLHICNRISPRSFTTTQRILILNKCFYDISEIVRRNAEQKLIPMWFRSYGDKLCVFFKNLRLESECLDKLPFATDLMHVLFKLVKISQILEELEFDQDTHLPKSLTAEKFFIWQHFYTMAAKQDKLRKLLPSIADLIQFISKCFKDPDFPVEAAIYNELISFTMSAIDVMGMENCEVLPPLALDLLKNPFVAKEVIPYAVSFYCEYASKETMEIHKDLLEIASDLLKMTALMQNEADQKHLFLKSLVLFSETLAQDNITCSIDVMSVKDELVLLCLDSADNDIKIEAFRALSLYCLLDFEEAKQLWPLFEKTLFTAQTDVKPVFLKNTIDIIKSHGPKLFDSDDDENEENKLENKLIKILSHFENISVDQNILMKGILKLYLAHHTFSSAVLAKLLLYLFRPDDDHIAKTHFGNFIQIYGGTKEEAECLTESFLEVVNMLFDSKKTDAYYHTCAKTACFQLVEFSRMYEENKDFEIGDKFKDRLVLQLTEKFIKNPKKINAFDLQDICHRIMPSTVENLVKLKANVTIIVESFVSPSFQQKNPFSKKSAKFFASYLKKIQTVMDQTSDGCQNSSKLNSSSDEVFLTSSKIILSSPEGIASDKENSF